MASCQHSDRFQSTAAGVLGQWLSRKSEVCAACSHSCCRTDRQIDLDTYTPIREDPQHTPLKTSLLLGKQVFKAEKSECHFHLGRRLNPAIASSPSGPDQDPYPQCSWMVSKPWLASTEGFPSYWIRCQDRLCWSSTVPSLGSWLSKSRGLWMLENPLCPLLSSVRTRRLTLDFIVLDNSAEMAMTIALQTQLAWVQSNEKTSKSFP